jgi:hypothetical protein
VDATPRSVTNVGGQGNLPFPALRSSCRLNRSDRHAATLTVADGAPQQRPSGSIVCGRRRRNGRRYLAPETPQQRSRGFGQPPVVGLPGAADCPCTSPPGRSSRPRQTQPRVLAISPPATQRSRALQTTAVHAQREPNSAASSSCTGSAWSTLLSHQQDWLGAPPHIDRLTLLIGEVRRTDPRGEEAVTAYGVPLRMAPAPRSPTACRCNNLSLFGRNRGFRGGGISRAGGCRPGSFWFWRHASRPTSHPTSTSTSPPIAAPAAGDHTRSRPLAKQPAHLHTHQPALLIRRSETKHQRRAFATAIAPPLAAVPAHDTPDICTTS